MEPSRFDELSKALATATSRRQALKTIAAAALGGLLGLGRLDTAFAAPKCHRAGLGCETNSKCCSKVCCNGKCCASGQVCQNGQCVTPVCANPASDACNVVFNCGPSNTCFCQLSVEGGSYCGSVGYCATCASNSDCGPGNICVAASCCASGAACVPLCI